MRSPRKVYIEQIRANADERQRFVNMTARVRVHRRGPDGAAYPAELLPEVYGGVYDVWEGRYTHIGDTFAELSVHPGHVKLIETFDDPGSYRVMSLGSQGGGKTEGIVIVAVLLSLWYPGKPGGVVAPTKGQREIVWNKFLKHVEPRGWVESINPGQQEIRLKNGALIQFVGATRRAKSKSSPIAGKDWAWAVEDEQQDIDDDALEEVDARGRINANYRVFSSATNESRGNFQRRVKQYEMTPGKRVVRFTGPENVFVPLAVWDRLKAHWDPEAYRRKILCEDLPADGRVYPAFSMNENVRPRPPKSAIGRSSEITPSVTKELYHRPYQYVVGVDFGVRVCASVILQCFRPEGDHLINAPTDRNWWVVGEVVTEGKTPDWHATQLMDWFSQRGMSASHFIAITGQDSNSANPDRSDFVLFRDRGINLTRAQQGKKLYVHHRFAMVNALLHAADGHRRLFVDCDANGKVAAPRVVDSLEGLKFNASDRPETFGKGTKGGEDLTHYTDALGYALFPFEKFRGSVELVSMGDGPGTRPWWEQDVNGR